ncbi:MAG: hypothetical protein ABJE95_28280 [Byssovorax sp.]
MRTLTAVIPAKSSLPPDLALLLAPIRSSEPSAAGKDVGHAEGALLDEQGRVIAFIVRLSPSVASGSPRTLVTANAVKVTDDSVLHLSWTEDQLLAEPRLDSNLQPHTVTDGGIPVESQWMPARPNVIPPGGEMNVGETAKEGLEGGTIGAVVGGAVGLVIGGPIVALGLAGFFAAGGGLAGILSGASQDTAAEAGEMKFDSLEPAPGEARDAALAHLEARLRDPAVVANGLVRATRFTPMTTTEPPPEPPPPDTSRRSAAARE